MTNRRGAGGSCFFSFYNGNTNLPGSGTQSLHFDQGDWHWPDKASSVAAGETWPHMPANLVINFSTEAIEPHNGPTELWPGSHLETACARGGARSITEEMLRRRASEAPPVLNCLPRGAASFRDLRLWHKGTPNRGVLPRHMLAICYSSSRSPDYGVAGQRAGRLLFSDGRHSSPSVAHTRHHDDPSRPPARTFLILPLSHTACVPSQMPGLRFPAPGGRTARHPPKWTSMSSSRTK